MKKLSKLYNWLLVSNRLKHLICGVIIFFIMLVFKYLENLIIGVDIFEDSLKTNLIVMFDCLNSLITTLIAMMSVEYIQTLYNGKFDWLDILAGCLFGIFITLIFVITNFIF